MRNLVFLHDNNGTFTDYSLEARDYLRDTFTLDYTEAEDYIYLGLRKPFYQNYIELSTFGSGLSLSVEYSTSAGWSSVDIEDDTKNLSRSGFIKWDLSDPSLWKASTVDGTDKYWLRLKLGADTSLNITGWNMVFSDDNDLLAEVRQISKLLAKGDTTFIAYHVAARNEMIQNLRNGGNATQQKVIDAPNLLDQWDLLKPEEIRQASKYLTLSKIYFDASTEISDKDYQRYVEYKNEFGQAFKLYYRSIDQNDDGVLQDEEKLALRTLTLNKL